MPGAPDVAIHMLGICFLLYGGIHHAKLPMLMSLLSTKAAMEIRSIKNSKNEV